MNKNKATPSVLPQIKRTPTFVKKGFPIKDVIEEDCIIRIFGFALLVVLTSASLEWSRHGLNFPVCGYLFSAFLLVLILFKTTLEYYFDYANLWLIAFTELTIRKKIAMRVDLSDPEIMDSGYDAIEQASDDLIGSIRNRYKSTVNQKWVRIAEWVVYPSITVILLINFVLLWLN